MKSLIKLSLLSLTTLTFIACGGGSSGGGGSATPSPISGGGGQQPTNLTIADASSDEGSMLTFTVTANPTIAEPITFDYRIDFAGQTASADDLSSDISGRSTIAASSDSTTISILIKDDDIKEPAETFRIVLSNLAPAGATFTNKTALGTIFASDPIKIRIIGAAGDEGGMITFRVTASPAIAMPINFQFEATVDNTTTAIGADLSGNLIDNGTIATNDSSTTISIATVNDNLREHNETFLVMLSDLSPTSDATFTDNEAIGTILANDDATGIVTISLVTDATASEENTGRINFKVKSEFTAISPFTFHYAVAFNNPFTNKSASSDDFAGATNGMATIPAGKDSTTISISIATDDTIEPDETFSLRLTNPTSPNATIDSAKNSATGRILNDDLGEISDATAIIGDTAITLNWTNPKSNIFAEVIIAQTTSTDAPLDCASATNVTIIDAQQKTSDTIEGLTNGTAYSFRICAKSNAGRLSGGVTLPNLIPEPTVDNNGNGLIEIATATELNNIRHNLAGTSLKTSSTAAGFTRGCPDSGCIGYELTANIDLSNSKYSNGWTPIGTFTKIFDGNNNRISGLRISTTDSNIGLFSKIQDATIRNLKLANVSVTGAGNVGALVGDATNSTLSNIELIGDANQTTNNPEIKGTGNNVGGLVGSFSGSIIDASSSLTVRGGANHIGGLIGVLQINSSIKYSNSSGSVSASGRADRVGGLVGQNNGAISNSWASGNVSNTIFNNNYYGGLVGRNNRVIRNSWASGNVSNTSTSNFYGGLVGLNDSFISNSWASGEVITTGDVVGGLVGNNEFGTIWNSWASGEAITKDDDFGGLVGNNAGTINGRNYRLDSDIGDGVNPNNSIKLDATTDLANLSGANGDTATADSNWHAGFDGPDAGTVVDLLTRFCDTNGNGMIDLGNVVGNPDERRDDNTVWVMAGGDPSNDLPPAPDGFYRIPAIRCIANTKGITDQTEIDAMRKIEIDRQRRLFPIPNP